MKKTHKWLAIGVAVTAGVGLAVAVIYLLQLAPIGSAYKAKTLCSGVFVSKRDPQSILEADVSADDSGVLRYVDARIDRAAQEVTADFLGFAKTKAVHRQGQGCALVHDDAYPRGARAAQGAGVSEAQPPKDDLDAGAGLPSGVDRARLDAALDWAFAEHDAAHLRRTRAVVIVHRDRVVAERYAPGFTAETPLIGWSMAKSVVNALVGVLVKEGRISLDDPAPIAAWQKPGDPRGKITWNQLLRMESGLQFEENYANPLADVIYMLLGVPDGAAYAAAKPLAAEPGTRWSYSSGTSNIVAHAMRRVAGESDYPSFPRRALFEPLRMTGAVLETDAAGNFVGSSFMYATARDWARFGLLYLHDGVQSGRRILPEGWVAYTRTPAPGAPDRQYGAHWWLRIPADFRCGNTTDALPADAFHAVGHAGQFLTVIPSRDLVLVRLGLSRRHCAWDHQRFVRLVLDALGEEKSRPGAGSLLGA